MIRAFLYALALGAGAYSEWGTQVATVVAFGVLAGAWIGWAAAKEKGKEEKDAR